MGVPAAIAKGAMQARCNDKFSLGNDVLETHVHSTDPEQSIESFMRMPVRWAALQSLGDGFADRDKLWYSLLAVPGFMIWERGAVASSPLGVVIGASGFGVAVLACTIFKVDTTLWATPVWRDGHLPCRFVHITDPVKYMALQTTPCSRVDVRHRRTGPRHGILLRMAFMKPESLVIAAARTGFIQLTKGRLIAMARDQEVMCVETKPHAFDNTRSLPTPPKPLTHSAPFTPTSPGLPQPARSLLPPGRTTFTFFVMLYLIQFSRHVLPPGRTELLPGGST